MIDLMQTMSKEHDFEASWAITAANYLCHYLTIRLQPFRPIPLTTEVSLKALKRLKATPCIKKKPPWGITTQTFAFTAKLLAAISLEEGRLAEGRARLQDAITTLARGRLAVLHQSVNAS